MWYDKCIVKILLLITKILSRHTENVYEYEIKEIEKLLLEEEKENDNNRSN